MFWGINPLQGNIFWPWWWYEKFARQTAFCLSAHEKHTCVTLTGYLGQPWIQLLKVSLDFDLGFHMACFGAPVLSFTRFKWYRKNIFIALLGLMCLELSLFSSALASKMALGKLFYPFESTESIHRLQYLSSSRNRDVLNKIGLFVGEERQERRRFYLTNISWISGM